MLYTCTYTAWVYTTLGHCVALGRHIADWCVGPYCRCTSVQYMTNTSPGQCVAMGCHIAHHVKCRLMCMLILPWLCVGPYYACACVQYLPKHHWGSEKHWVVILQTDVYAGTAHVHVYSMCIQITKVVYIWLGRQITAWCVHLYCTPARAQYWHTSHRGSVYHWVIIS